MFRVLFPQHLEKAAVRGLTARSVSFEKKVVSEALKGAEAMEHHFFPRDGVL